MLGKDIVFPYLEWLQKVPCIKYQLGICRQCVKCRNQPIEKVQMEKDAYMVANSVREYQ